MKSFILSLVLFFSLFCFFSKGFASQNLHKGLILVFCSDDKERDKIFKRAWQTCIEEYQQDFEIYYVQYSIHGESTPMSSKNELTLKRPKEYKKQKDWGLIECLHILRDRIEEFDFVIKADIDSFLWISKLKNFLLTQLEPCMYLGNVVEYENFQDKWDYVDRSFTLLGKQSAKFLSESLIFVEALGPYKYLDEAIVVGAILGRRGIRTMHVPSYRINRFIRPYKIINRIEGSTFVFCLDLRSKTKSSYEKEKNILEELLELFC